jgi:hypothetical protein
MMATIRLIMVAPDSIKINCIWNDSSDMAAIKGDAAKLPIAIAIGIQNKRGIQGSLLC